MLENSISVCEDDVMHNTRIRTYRTGMNKITVANRKVFKESGWELSERSKGSDNDITHKPQTKGAESRTDSVRRSKNRIFDIIIQNEWSYFVTLTFSPEYVNRFSSADVKSFLHKWLDNMTKHHSLKYLLVPELHKSSAIHLHGLVIGGVDVIDSGTRRPPEGKKPLKIETLKRKRISLDDCRMVYNLPQWKYGFSTAEPLYGDLSNTAKYITKYITKDVTKIFGNYYYAGGNGLVRDVPFVLADVPYEEFTADSDYFCEPICTWFKFKTVDSESSFES